MAKPKPPKRTLESYPVKHMNKNIKAGDCVLMRPAEPSKPSYVARIEGIEADGRGSNVKIHVRWYYRPEESIGGRRQFHGSKEVFLSDHFDVQSADTIEAKCTVHSFKSYTKLDAVGNEDFFCRFEYNSATGAFNPDRVAVYCKCEMPYNPDDLMVQCEGCSDCICLIFWSLDVWFCEHFVSSSCEENNISLKKTSRTFKSLFTVHLNGIFVQSSALALRFHPACIDMTVEEAERLDHFFCESCSAEGQSKLPNPHSAIRHSDTKVDTKRRRRFSINPHQVLACLFLLRLFVK
uniref:Zinc-mediated transcriptional activator n=1 Tax=Trifolium repens TaxID=3899 RepID=D3YBF8_TRIRP|nr:zinc-mediated transcriptional activator [Trifolium repens]